MCLWFKQDVHALSSWCPDVIIFFLHHLDAYNEMVVCVIMGVSQTEDCILQRLHFSAATSSNLAEGHLNRCHGPAVVP